MKKKKMMRMMKMILKMMMIEDIDIITDIIVEDLEEC
jgi:hypothetical protein